MFQRGSAKSAQIPQLTDFSKLSWKIAVFVYFFLLETGKPVEWTNSDTERKFFRGHGRSIIARFRFRFLTEFPPFFLAVKSTFCIFGSFFSCFRPYKKTFEETKWRGWEERATRGEEILNVVLPIRVENSSGTCQDSFLGFFEVFPPPLLTQKWPLFFFSRKLIARQFCEQWPRRVCRAHGTLHWNSNTWNYFLGGFYL